MNRPGEECLHMSPFNLSRLYFDGIPYLPNYLKEHDILADTLRNEGVEVVYSTQLFGEAMDAAPEGTREKFIKQFVYEAGIKTPKFKNSVIKFLMEYSDNKELVLKTMEGININELHAMERDMEHSLVDLVTEESKFLADPMPNLVFTRDPFASIGNGISLNRMYAVTRNRETIYAEYIFNYHPDYKDTVKYYDRYNPYHIEGGDILVLNNHVLAIGVSQRTLPESIEQLALNLFKDPECPFDTVLAFNIPNSRAFMHLDTVFTQIDYDKFTYHPGIMDTLQVFEIKEDVMEGVKVREINDSLENILEKYLKHKNVIKIGKSNQISKNISQKILKVNDSEKVSLLIKVLKKEKNNFVHISNFFNVSSNLFNI